MQVNLTHYCISNQPGKITQQLCLRGFQIRHVEGKLKQWQAWLKVVNFGLNQQFISHIAWEQKRGNKHIYFDTLATRKMYTCVNNLNKTIKHQ